MAPGEGGERGVLVELFEDEFLRAGADAAAAGEDGLAAGRQAFDEGENLQAVGLGEGFEVIEDEQRLRGAERVEQEPDALVLGGLRDVGLPELAGEFIEHLQEARHEEVAERALAVVVHLAVLHGDEDDALEEACDLRDEGSFFSREGEGDAKAFHTTERKKPLFVSQA